MYMQRDDTPLIGMLGFPWTHNEAKFPAKYLHRVNPSAIAGDLVGLNDA
jgi:hypothetical protein